MSTVSVDKFVYNFIGDGIFRYIQPSSSHCLKNRHLFKLLFINDIIFMCGKILKTLGFLFKLSQRLCGRCITRVTK